LRAGQVLHINEPDDLIFSINDDHLVNKMLLKCVYGHGGEFVALDGDRVCRHVIANEMIGNVAAFLIGADKIAVGEDALQRALLIGGHHGAGLALFHGGEGGSHGVGGLYTSELIALAHDVSDAGEQLGEILGLKTAGLQEYHGQRVAEGEHVGGAGGGGKVERAGFGFHADIKHHVAVGGEGGIEFTDESDD